jgi:uncharacterized protein (DUF2147 family)
MLDRYIYDALNGCFMIKFLSILFFLTIDGYLYSNNLNQLELSKPCSQKSHIKNETSCIEGYWMKLNDNQTPRTIFAIYCYEGIYYGRIVATFNNEGVLHQTISTKDKDKAIGVVDCPPIIGLDLIWGLERTDTKCINGKILDPIEGKTYKAEAWVNNNGDLIFRGKFLLFWKDMTWKKASKELLEYYKIDCLDLTKIIPSIPKIK